MSDTTNSIWTTLARGVEGTAAETGDRTMMWNFGKETNYLNLLIERRVVDGIIIAPTARDQRQLAELKQLQVL